MNESKPKVSVFYRMLKAEKPHQFAGLYAVEKVFFKGTELLRREIVHEWDLRIISESILAKLGGGDAYESFKLDNELKEIEAVEGAKEVEPRTAEELADLTPRKLKNELRLPKKA